MALPKAKTLAVIKLSLTINLKKKLQINKKTGQRKLPGLIYSLQLSSDPFFKN